jgi:hypothetical protein
VPTSAQITEDKCRQIGLAKCSFDITNFEVKDGRKANITIAVSGLSSVLSMAKASRFVTTPGLHHLGLVTGVVPASS